VRKSWFVVLLALLLPAPAFADAHISWSVKNRFRLFDSDQITLQIENALLETLTTSTISKAYPALAKILRADKPSGQPALYLRTHFQSTTSGRYDDGYVAPKSQIITASLENRDALDTQCVWSVATVVQPAQPCAQKVDLEVPFSAGTFTADAEIQVQVVGRAAYQAHVLSRDQLIVGFGDSYAGGEGNPDKPAELTFLHPVVAKRLADWWSPWYVFPPATPDNVLPPAASADWWSNECHRSLFSPHVLAALKLAASNPTASVTFLSFACSGAAVLDGLVAPQFGPPGEDRIGSLHIASIAKKYSQLDQALYVLCESGYDHTAIPLPRGAPNWRYIYYAMAGNTGTPALPTCVTWKRKPDVIFLTIGGNDIGFAGLGAWAILPEQEGLTADAENYYQDHSWNHMGIVCPSVPYPGLPGLPHDPRCEFPGSRNFGGEELVWGELPYLLKFANQAFLQSGISTNAQVVHVAYPAPFNDQDGATCGSTRDGNHPNAEFTSDADLGLPWVTLNTPLRVVKLKLGVSETRAASLKEAAYEPLISQIQAFAESNHWLFAASPLSYVRHGFCAGKGSGFIESDFAFPLLDSHGWKNTSITPTSWDPYSSRARWIRTANDSLLTEMVSNSDGVVQQESFSGELHPTAEGEAAVADQIYTVLPVAVVAPLSPTPGPPTAPTSPIANPSSIPTPPGDI